MGRALLVSGPCGAGKTTVGAELSRLLGCPVVEVDAVKLERRGTTVTSRLDHFTEAGRRAAAALRQQGCAIVVEAFAGESWVDLVIRELPEGTQVSHFYLWCDLAEAVRRKAGELSPEVVGGQFQRFNGATFPGRVSFDTTARPATEVASEIAAMFLGSGTRPVANSE